MAINSELYALYIKKIKPELVKELNLKSVMQVPKLTKIVINMGVGEATTNKAVITDAVQELTAIAGQKAIITYAKKANASFKIRKDMAIGVKVTLRGQKMYDFLYKLINLSLPRIRDFRGVKANAFDNEGNYTLGIKEFIIFPEINLDRVKTMKGCDISIITSTNKKKESYLLLLKLGMPFADKNREDNNK